MSTATLSPAEGEVVLAGGELEGADTPLEADLSAITLAIALARSAGACCCCCRDLTLNVSRRRARPSGPGGIGPRRKGRAGEARAGAPSAVGFEAASLLCLLRSRRVAIIVARPVGTAGLGGEVMVEAAGVEREGTESSEVGLDGWGANVVPGVGLNGRAAVSGDFSALLSCSPLRLAA